MKIRSAFSFGLIATAFALAVTACSGGGGSKSLPSMQQGALGSKVGVTFTVTIGGGSWTQSGSQRTPKYLPTSTQSLVIEYIGDNPSATPVPGSAKPPSTAVIATTLNVTTSTTNPPPAGQCFNNSGSYICTVVAQLPVGVLDVYVLAYDGQNGTGNLVGGTVVVSQVSQNGAITQPGTSTPVSFVLGAGAANATFNLITITPNGLPNPSVTAPSYPSTAPPYAYSTAGTLNLGSVPPNTPITSVVVTDNDTSGATCLVYIKAGTTTATPCPFSTAKSSVTLMNSSDAYAVLYNGQHLPGGTISLTGTGIANPLAVTVAGSVALAPVTTASKRGPIGTMVYDSVGKKIYVGMGDNTAPLYAIPYSSTTGYGTPVAVTVATVNGSPASNLSGSGSNANGGPNEMVIGPDNNIWIAEHDSRANTQYVAVAAINSAVINPLNGSTISPGPGVFAEYTLMNQQVFENNNDGPPLHAIASMGGYIWLLDKRGDFWRINPTTGLVNPNLSAGYMPGSPPTNAIPPTDPTGVTYMATHTAIFAALIPLGNTLYVGNENTGSISAITGDTSSTPSTGICSPPGGSPCIGTFQALQAGALCEPRTGFSDGTSYYTLSSCNEKVYQFTPPNTLATSSLAFPSTSGGLFGTSDGYLWTLTGSGVAGMSGMTSTATFLSVSGPTACGSGPRSLNRGAFPFMIGPDGSLLFTPNWSDNTGTAPSVLCAVVY